MNDTSLTKLTDQALFQTLQRTCLEGNRVTARLLVLLIEVEDRRLHQKDAYPSLFEFCLRRMHMSEGEAFRRIAAARLVRRFPKLLPRIEQGDIHLSALVQLRDHFTEHNVVSLVDAAKGKNKMELAELIARMAPRPDVPGKLRKLPQHDKGSRFTRGSKPSIDPLSEARWRLQLTGSRAFRDKLLRARDWMMHSNPSGDLAVVVERALDELLEKLGKQLFGRRSRKSTDTSVVATLEGDVPAKVATPPSKQRESAPRPGLARAPMDQERRRRTPHFRQRKSRNTPPGAKSSGNSG